MSKIIKLAGIFSEESKLYILKKEAEQFLIQRKYSKFEIKGDLVEGTWPVIDIQKLELHSSKQANEDLEKEELDHLGNILNKKLKTILSIPEEEDAAHHFGLQITSINNLHWRNYN